jgi:type IV pilus assembly protein PilA
MIGWFMFRKNREKGFTLVELLVVIAIIGILAAISIPIYKGYTVDAKMAEAVNGVRYIATALNNYALELTVNGGASAWPSCPDLTAIQATLGVGLTNVGRISAARISQATGEIEATLVNIDGSVDGQTLSLVPTVASDGSIQWTWSGTLPTRYLPKQ